MLRQKPKKPISDQNPDQQMDPITLKSLQFSKHSSKTHFLKSKHKRSNLSTFSIILLTFLIPFLFYLLYPFSPSVGPTPTFSYSIIIDGGSTGTRAHIFRYQEGKEVVVVGGNGGHWSTRVNPGLSAYERDPEEAKEAIVELVEFGKKNVPREMWSRTDVRLMATGGMRLLDGVVQERILESCRKVLRGSGFRFMDHWASVISGSDEGLYAWVVANYALGTLGGNPDQTTGIIELGGASAQVTFVSNEPIPPEFARTLRYGNMTYNLYTNSLLHFGQNVAFDSLKELLTSSGLKLDSEVTVDPCTPKGYAQGSNSYRHGLNSLSYKYSSSFHASGNFSECRAAALKLLQKGKEKCSYHHCTLGSTFIPRLHGRFLATENFFHTSQFFGLSPKHFLHHLMEAGKQFCGDHWSNIRRQHASYEEEDLVHYCFSSAYILALLHDSLGVSLDDERVRYASEVKSIPLDWALGAFILQSSEGVVVNHEWTYVLSNYFPNLSLLVGAGIFLSLIVCYISHRRKPYFKTIYDLEKGRYIVTRINR